MRYHVYQIKKALKFSHFYSKPEGPRGPFSGHIFNAKPVGPAWVSPDVYRLYPTRDPWDIALYLNGSALTATEEAVDRLDLFVKNRGVELLPYEVEGERYYVINVLEAPACLNRDESEIQQGPNPEILKYVFFPLRFTRSLFKLPDRIGGSPLVAEDDSRPEWSFKRQIELNDFKGINFELLWEGD